eukprot:4340559-Alexandrium_andersonii.AAC.1
MVDPACARPARSVSATNGMLLCAMCLHCSSRTPSITQVMVDLACAHPARSPSTINVKLLCSMDSRR